jgi:PAS domain S-box-containing protein
VDGVAGHERPASGDDPASSEVALALAAGGLALWRHDLAAGRVTWSKGIPELLRLPASRLAGMDETFAGLAFDEDRSLLLDRRATALAAGAIDYQGELRVRCGDGVVRWLQLRGTIHRDLQGRARSILGAAVDISERKLAEEQRDLLLREMNHRVKNILAVVLAIAHQTGTRAKSMASFLDAFGGRLGALAVALGLATSSAWRAVGLRQLVHETLLPHGADAPGRFRLALEDLRLRPTAAQNLALVLHELATNAVKHGALSAPRGRIVLTAQVVDQRAGRALELVWREENGPPVMPPTREGFGMSLLGRVAKRQHHGRLQLDWRPEGLLCRLLLPAAEVLEPLDPDPSGPPGAWQGAVADATASHIG